MTAEDRNLGDARQKDRVGRVIMWFGLAKSQTQF